LTAQQHPGYPAVKYPELQAQRQIADAAMYFRTERQTAAPQQFGHARVTREGRRIEMTELDSASAIYELAQHQRADTDTLMLIGYGNRHFGMTRALLIADETSYRDRNLPSILFQFGD